MELGPEDVSLLERCPYFRGCYVQASMELGPEDVSLLERCPHFRGFYVHVCTGFNVLYLKHGYTYTNKAYSMQHHIHTTYNNMVGEGEISSYMCNPSPGIWVARQTTKVIGMFLERLKES